MKVSSAYRNQIEGRVLSLSADFSSEWQIKTGARCHTINLVVVLAIKYEMALFFAHTKAKPLRLGGAVLAHQEACIACHGKFVLSHQE